MYKFMHLRSMHVVSRTVATVPARLAGVISCVLSVSYSPVVGICQHAGLPISHVADPAGDPGTVVASLDGDGPDGKPGAVVLAAQDTS